MQKVENKLTSGERGEREGGGGEAGLFVCSPGGEGIGSACLVCLFILVSDTHTADDALHVLYLKLEEFRRKTNAFG